MTKNVKLFSESADKNNKTVIFQKEEVYGSHINVFKRSPNGRVYEPRYDERQQADDGLVGRYAEGSRSNAGRQGSGQGRAVGFVCVRPESAVLEGTPPRRGGVLSLLLFLS